MSGVLNFIRNNISMDGVSSFFAGNPVPPAPLTQSAASTQPPVPHPQALGWNQLDPLVGNLDARVTPILERLGQKLPTTVKNATKPVFQQMRNTLHNVPQTVVAPALAQVAPTLQGVSNQVVRPAFIALKEEIIKTPHQALLEIEKTLKETVQNVGKWQNLRCKSLLKTKQKILNILSNLRSNEQAALQAREQLLQDLQQMRHKSSNLFQGLGDIANTHPLTLATQLQKVVNKIKQKCQEVHLPVSLELQNWLTQKIASLNLPDGHILRSLPTDILRLFSLPEEEAKRGLQAWIDRLETEIKAQQGFISQLGVAVKETVHQNLGGVKSFAPRSARESLETLKGNLDTLLENVPIPPVPQNPNWPDLIKKKEENVISHGTTFLLEKLLGLPQNEGFVSTVLYSVCYPLIRFYWGTFIPNILNSVEESIDAGEARKYQKAKHQLVSGLAKHLKLLDTVTPQCQTDEDIEKALLNPLYLDNLSPRDIQSAYVDHFLKNFGPDFDLAKKLYDIIYPLGEKWWFTDLLLFPFKLCLFFPYVITRPLTFVFAFLVRKIHNFVLKHLILYTGAIPKAFEKLKLVLGAEGNRATVLNYFALRKLKEAWLFLKENDCRILAQEGRVASLGEQTQLKKIIQRGANLVIREGDPHHQSLLDIPYVKNVYDLWALGEGNDPVEDYSKEAALKLSGLLEELFTKQMLQETVYQRLVEIDAAFVEKDPLPIEEEERAENQFFDVLDAFADYLSHIKFKDHPEFLPALKKRVRDAYTLITKPYHIEPLAYQFMLKAIKA